VLPVLFSLIGALYVVALILVSVFETKLIFPVPSSVSSRTPEIAGLSFEDLHIPVEGKTQIHAWWVPAQQPTSTVILYFHGNAELLEDEADNEVPFFHQTGANLLMVDYRGYGGSSHLQTTGRTTAEDARAAMRYLREQRQVPDANIVICGWSIGTGVATQLALEAPEASGLILISPITSVYDVANQVWVFRYVLRPAQWLSSVNAFDNKAKIASIHMPVLIMTGSEDPIAEPWMAKTLYQRANEPKTMRIIEGASHNDIFGIGEHTILHELQTFLDARHR
jgi:pimeloyl-ACP methyl ester carboxylesterase